jgi:hypothetical protein
MKKAPYIVEAWTTVAFCVGLLVGWASTSACAAAPPIVADGITIESRVAVCMLENVGQPDEVIVSRCSPSASQPAAAAQTIRVVLAVCHLDAMARDGGQAADAGGGP